MDKLQHLEEAIQQIQARNARVEQEKAWETSFTRKLAIALLTYFVVVLFFVGAGFTKPFVNALVPTMGFLLSTLSLPIIKKYWMKYWLRKGK